MSIGIWQVVLVLMIVLIIFGAGKLPKVAGDLAKGIKNFKQGLKDDEAAGTTTQADAAVPPPAATTTTATPGTTHAAAQPAQPSATTHGPVHEPATVRPNEPVRS